MSDPANKPMVSEVSICNQALSGVGADEITSFADQSRTAQWCRNNYPFIRDAVIESRMWTFATVRKKSITTDMDEWEQYWSHPVPDGWLSVFWAYRNVSVKPPALANWVREEQQILSDQSTLWIKGVQRVQDTNKFSPMFVQTLAARLAADMAIPIAENRQLQIDLWGLYEAKLSDAAARDGQQGSNEAVRSNSLIDARAYGGG